ncbi:MAG: type III secretion system export apparatus subunit SctS [Ottowia sp.]|nr:type III secretion system export apparatus subunit SctS [Ottowia sp.]
MYSSVTAAIFSLFQETLWVVLFISLPALAVAVLVGILVSLVQTLFQLQDQALPFAVKLVAVGLTLAMTGGWIAQQILYLAQRAFALIPTI